MKNRHSIKNLHLLFILILFLNFIFLFINIYYIIKRNNKFFFEFKNIDLISLFFIMRSYKYISLYLNNKYNLDLKKKIIQKKTIILHTVGSYSENFQIIYRNRIIEGLNEYFNFEFNPNNPDYLIYDVYNCDFLSNKYINSIKIAFYSENQIPDFNMADYAIGFHNINYLDRYFKRTALISVFENRYIKMKNKDFNKIKKENNKNINKTKFCGAVISNFISTNGFRMKFIKELNKYKNIDIVGKYNNHIGDHIQDKIQFLSSYKFSIAIENSEGDGYISEKIIDSFLAGTIPIYYGGYNIDQYINKNAFILIKGEKDMMNKIEYIKKIDNDNELYNKILKENILINDNFIEDSKKEKIEFFKHIFEQDKKLAKRIDNKK